VLNSKNNNEIFGSFEILEYAKPQKRCRPFEKSILL